MRLLLAVCSLAGMATAQSWVQLQPSGTPPPGRFNNTAVYDPGSDRLIVFGGFVSSTCCQAANDLWALANADGHAGSRQWINLIPANAAGSPPALAAASAVYDGTTNRMIVFGGQAPAAGSSNAVWILKNANGAGGTPAWQQLQFPTGAIQPPARQNHQAFFDSINNRMIVFGGLSSTETGPVPLNDTWVLTNANGTAAQAPVWMPLAAGSTLPSPRHAFGAFYDTAHNRLLVYGGCTDASYSCFTTATDLWALSNANGIGTPLWSGPLPVVGGPPTAQAQFASTAYDPGSNKFIVIGGKVGQGGPFGTFTSDTWVLSSANDVPAVPQWTKLTPGQSPAPRGQSVPPGLYDPASRRFIVFGGPGLNDTWTIQFP